MQGRSRPQDSEAGVLVGRAGRLRQTLEQRRLADPLTPAEQRALELRPTQLTAAPCLSLPRLLTLLAAVAIATVLVSD